MQLRKYQREDAAIICNWIKSEKILYQWSADRICKYPLTAEDLNTYYEPIMQNDSFVLLSAVDENGTVIGHLFIRYPDRIDNTTVRFGFVIIDADIRGRGNGRKMLQLAIAYAKNSLHASKITLGVFDNNASARHCYESVGFQPTGKNEKYKTPMGEWDCAEMELKI